MSSKIITWVPILIVQTPRNLLGVVNKFVSHPPMSNNSKVARLFQMDERTNLFFPKGLQTAKEGEEDTGAAGMDEEMVEVSSVEFAMAAVIAEAEALDPATLEEARRRMDWPKWDLAIKAELEVLKKVGTWGVVERLRGRNIVLCKWVLHIKKDAAGRIERFKAQLVAKGFT